MQCEQFWLWKVLFYTEIWCNTEVQLRHCTAIPEVQAPLQAALRLARSLLHAFGPLMQTDSSIVCAAVTPEASTATSKFTGKSFHGQGWQGKYGEDPRRWILAVVSCARSYSLFPWLAFFFFFSDLSPQNGWHRSVKIHIIRQPPGNI